MNSKYKNRKSGYTQITDKDFKNIKLLQESGINKSDASRVTKRSYNTITMIYGAETLAEYKKAVAQHGLKYPKSGEKDEGEKLASVGTLEQVIEQAKEGGNVIMTNAKNFPSVFSLATFVRNMSDKGVTVAFFPDKEETK